MDLVFKIQDRIFLPKAISENIEGTVIGIWICEMGIQYKVRYFYQGKAEEVYFYENELRRPNGR